MEEPSPRSSRLALAGALIAAIVVGGAGFLMGRATVAPTQQAVAPSAAPTLPAPAPDPPAVRGILDRAALIALAGAAADAAAAGKDPPPDVTESDGRRFAMRLPFGCDGPAPADGKAPMRWHYDPDDQALRIHVEPVTWPGQAWFAGDSSGVETIEGFWIARPWTASEACPRGNDPPDGTEAEAVMPADQSLALGQIFSADSGRGGRRNGEAYETTLRVAQAGLDTSQGFRLRISGRISSAHGLPPVSCRQLDGPERRPLCLINVVLDEVAIENPITEDILAAWNLAGRDAEGH
ncbi:hypothetical protein [Sphingosinicella sp. BN140058]|uniref:hypothetical protein n=1 Tax=Sphingosinicella sp. BN140058 TaxID=1892855 RepID=UPI001011C807|nr:hypothetical protein [Sphingosinicella sp. BN140058]QAY76515.1 hypothetical protein ETR14_08420 [Sphingosinicella sp. BN140058]